MGSAHPVSVEIFYRRLIRPNKYATPAVTAIARIGSSRTSSRTRSVRTEASSATAVLAPALPAQ